jgi:acetyl esterase|tara:strand:- start:33 stop:935 length:903 start_codon:yes stop_codon:yes gene_type:complete
MAMGETTAQRMALKAALAPLFLICFALSACSPEPNAPESCVGVKAQPSSLRDAQSFTYRRASDRDLKLHVFSPAGSPKQARPAILFFFGGGWRVGKISALEPQAREFAKQGYVTILADYRVKCRDGTTILAAQEDARAAWDWVRNHHSQLGVDPKRIVLAGGSAGGQLALATAQKSPEDAKPAALMLFNPAVDLVTPAAWWAKPIAKRISPSTLPVDALPPTLIFHGTGDHRVPIQTVKAFCRRARETDRICEVVSYAGQEHGFYHSNRITPGLGINPYRDTLDRSEAFLARQGLAPSAP